MATARELLNKIKQRTWVLMIASGGDLDYADAQRAAARAIRDEERARKRNTPLQQPQLNPGEVTVSNARQWLYDKLAEIALRLKAHIIEDEPPPQFKKHTSDPEVYRGSTSTPVAPKPEPEPPADQIIGGFAFGATTSERIDDSEFHTSVQSPVTQTWRRSVELAEKRRSTRWVG
jgi:hypothetical protein